MLGPRPRRETKFNIHVDINMEISFKMLISRTAMLQFRIWILIFTKL